LREEANNTKKDIFEEILKSEPLFTNREVMRPTYMPEILPHRDREINNLASILAPALRGETPSNVFIYGKTGTGKTAVAKFVGRELLKKGKKLNKKVHFIYINCEVVDTHYRVLQNIANHFIEEWVDRIPFTGWPTDEVYSKLKQMMDKDGGVAVIILDEVDKLKGDEALYNLSRINSDLERARVSVVGISNDLKFTEFLDPRVKSSLGEENMVFYPYNADQLQDILKQRAELALKPGVLKEEVIPLCAALAAQEHGDARRALDLLRISAELAEREGAKKITERHVRMAQNKIEIDRVTEVIRTLPIHSKLVLASIIIGEEEHKKTGLPSMLTTGEVFDIYKELCKKERIESLTQRRIADLISELDMLGVINARTISKGRYGRTREIQTAVSKDEIFKILKEEKDDVLNYIVGYKKRGQARLL